MKKKVIPKVKKGLGMKGSKRESWEDYKWNDNRTAGSIVYEDKEEYEPKIEGELPRDGVVPVTINRKPYDKIMWWVNRCSQEVGGIGKVVNDPERGLIVTDAFLSKQTVSSADVELTAEQLTDTMVEHFGKGEPGELLFWWHSHVNMDVRWSGTDLDTFYRHGRDGMLLGIVFNKKGEKTTALFLGGDKHRPPVFLDNLPLTVEQTIPLDNEEMEKEFIEKVTMRTYSSNYPYGKKVNEATQLGLNSYYDDDGKPDGQLYCDYTVGKKEYITDVEGDTYVRENAVEGWRLMSGKINSKSDEFKSRVHGFIYELYTDGLYYHTDEDWAGTKGGIK